MLHFQNLVLPSNIEECNEMFRTQKHKNTRFILKTKILIKYKINFSLLTDNIYASFGENHSRHSMIIY